MNCIERVYGPRVTSYGCSRKAGFGPEGKYCKQHARRHENKSAEITLWKTGFRWIDWKNPIEIEMAREISGASFINEHGHRSKMETEWGKYFLTKNDAIAFVIARAENKKSAALKEIAEIDSALSKLKMELP